MRPRWSKSADWWGRALADPAIATNEPPHAHARFSAGELNVRLDQAWRVLNFNQELIRAADQKVYLLVCMSALMGTVLANNLHRVAAFSLAQNILLIVFIGAGAAFFAFTLVTLFARAGRARTGHSANLIYFGDIATRVTAQEYADDFRVADLQTVLDDLNRQTHSVASIATRKYQTYRYAWAALLLQVATFLVLQLTFALKIS